MTRSSSHPRRGLGALAALTLLASMTFANVGVSQAVNVPQDKIVNPNPENWTPNVLDGVINTIVQIDNEIYAGGQFTQVQAATGGTIYPRSNLFAFNATTGAIDTNFAPTFDNIVKALAVAPDGDLFVGGYFSSVNGDTSVKKLVKLNPANGQRITAFSANANGQVWDIKVSGNRLFVGGRFTSIKNVARDRLAALNVTTGAVDPNVSFSITDPHTSDSVPWVYSMDVSADGSHLVIIGNFMKVDGQPRPQVALIDLSTPTATLADWETDRYIPPCFSNAFDTYMRDVDFSPDGSYFVIVATGGPNVGTLCDAAVRWNTDATGSALQPAWVDATGGDTLSSVAITGSVVYAGGHQRWMNNYYGKDSAGPGCGLSPRDRRARPLQRRPVLLEPHEGSRRGRLRAVLHRRPGSGWAATPITWPARRIARSRSSLSPAARPRRQRPPTPCRATSTKSPLRRHLGPSTHWCTGPTMAPPSAARRASALRPPIGAPPEASSRSRARSTAGRPTASSMRGPSTELRWDRHKRST